MLCKSPILKNYLSKYWNWNFVSLTEFKYLPLYFNDRYKYLLKKHDNEIKNIPSLISKYKITASLGSVTNLLYYVSEYLEKKTIIHIFN